MFLHFFSSVSVSFRSACSLFCSASVPFRSACSLSCSALIPFRSACSLFCSASVLFRSAYSLFCSASVLFRSACPLSCSAPLHPTLFHPSHTFFARLPLFRLEPYLFPSFIPINQFAHFPAFLNLKKVALHNS